MNGGKPSPRADPTALTCAPTRVARIESRNVAFPVVADDVVGAEREASSETRRVAEPHDHAIDPGPGSLYHTHMTDILAGFSGERSPRERGESMSAGGFCRQVAVLVVSGFVSGCTMSPAGPEGPAQDPGSVLGQSAHGDCDTPGDLRARIDALEGEGTLNHGRATALRAKLDLAERWEAQGRSDKAAEAYAALIAQLEDWVADGTLSEEDVEALLHCAEDVADGPDAEIVLVSSGGIHSCGLTSDGAAYCWGDNMFGQLGNGGFIDSDTPVEVVGGHAFSEISAGVVHTCGLTTAGDAYCWGRNLEGRLGDGTSSLSTGTPTPVLVLGGYDWVDVSAGNAHTCGVTTVGAAYCWGSNFGGELGNGTTTDSDTPVAVAGGLVFAEITAGSRFSCGLSTVGAFCWGDNLLGSLGNGTTTNSNTPVAVAGGHDFVEISAGENHACGRTTAGVVYCWGSNSFGELGDGTNTGRDAPAELSGGLRFSDVVAGESHSCGVTTDGPAYCWGFNEFGGKLGDGTNTSSNVPTAVVGGLEFLQISAGTSHTCGVTSAEDLYCWGGNDQGQLGDGTNTNSNVPVTVASP